MSLSSSAYHPTLSFCSSRPNLTAAGTKKRREFVLMFVQSGGNKLGRDLANQNSLHKLSDPGGSRALDKQDWLFQRHAYITPIWAWAITHRQQREYKPASYRRDSAEKHGEISGFSLCKWGREWEILLLKSLRPWYTTDVTLNTTNDREAETKRTAATPSSHHKYHWQQKKLKILRIRSKYHILIQQPDPRVQRERKDL